MSHKWWFWGRVIYGVPLGLTGLVYIINPHGTVESLTSFIPGELGLVYISGFLWLMLGCAVALNFHTRLVCRGIIALLCAYLVIIHIPALTTGEHINIVCFELLRNLSLMGGAFFILALDQQASVQRAKKEHQTIY